MNVFFRTDASSKMGQGHVMRCLTLADDLRDGNATVSFICREHDGDLCDLIEGRGYAVSRLPASSASVRGQDRADHATWLGVAWEEDASQTSMALEAAGVNADWLIVDHYGIDYRWEKALRACGPDIMVIDDLADRPHDCDLFLDQNYYGNPSRRYDGLLESYCTRFFGPEYVLLRKEFRLGVIGRGRERWPRNRLFLFFGGSDGTRQTEVAMDAVLGFDPSLPMDVIVNSSNPRAVAIAHRCEKLPHVRYFKQTDRMAELMADAMLALGAGGIATFERLYMHLPSIVVAAADNQREPLCALADAGYIDYLGEAEKVSVATWLSALRRWKISGVKYRTLDVATNTKRLLNALRVKIVPFERRHVESTFRFLQDPDLRASFAMTESPDWNIHVRYWQRKFLGDMGSTFAIETDGVHIGNCGIKVMPGSTESEAWIYLSRTAQKRSGSGEAAFRRLMRFAFRNLGLSRLYLHVMLDNERALSLYRKIGFRPTAEPVNPAVWKSHAANMCQLVIAR